MTFLVFLVIFRCGCGGVGIGRSAPVTPSVMDAGPLSLSGLQLLPGLPLPATDHIMLTRIDCNH